MVHFQVVLLWRGFCCYNLTTDGIRQMYLGSVCLQKKNLITRKKIISGCVIIIAANVCGLYKA